MSRPLCALSLLLTFSLISLSASAQQRSIGRWRAHLPYNNAMGVATDGNTLYTISEKGFFTYNAVTGEQEKFSKVEGMHETGTAAIAYDAATGTCIIAYENSNIDLYRNRSFKVLPDLKNKSFSGSKSINHIFSISGLAYISTGLGIVVIDLDRQQVKETYVFTSGGQTIAINALTADSSHFYAATPRGLYRILRSHPTPQVFASWQAVETTRAYKQLATAGGNRVYTTSVADSIFRVAPSGLVPVYAGDSITTITRIDGGKETLYIGQRNIRNGLAWLKFISPADLVVDSVRVGFAKGTVELADGSPWFADLYQGLGRRDASGNVGFIIPPGPNSHMNTGLYAHNGELWIAHGGMNAGYNRLGSLSGLSKFQYEDWKIYQPYTYDLFRDSVFDFLDVIKDQRDGTVYAGTYNSGLFELKADGSARIIKQGALDSVQSNTEGFPATSLAIDDAGYLWVTQIYTQNEIASRSPSGEWFHYPVPSRQYRLAFGMTIDDYGQKWYYSPVGGGIMVFNDGGTPENKADDQQPRLLGIGNGNGNLPSTGVRCLAKDRDGAIWIGTDNGIGIVSCPSGILDGSCEAELRTVQYDQFAGVLFSGESVRTIAVDGGNRKWIGTTNGVWLLSPDAGTILNRFTVDNSPLPSNLIQKIAVDGITGDVYIGTDQGLVSYRGTSTDGGEVNSTVQTFPNPVPSGYSGTIAIRGLVSDADVRITDIAGQLIYRTKAAGGQAVWNGLDYTGTRPQSGVYLIFITNKDGSQTSVGKMMFMH